MAQFRKGLIGNKYDDVCNLPAGQRGPICCPCVWRRGRSHCASGVAGPTLRGCWRLSRAYAPAERGESLPPAGSSLVINLPKVISLYRMVEVKDEQQLLRGSKAPRRLSI